MLNMKKFDVLLVLTLLGASFFAGLQAWQLRKENKTGLSKIVGTVSSLQGEAFRKGDADFFYQPAVSGIKVAENDQLTTGINSEAQIQLDQLQSKILLKEMSHIILKFKNDSFALDIRSGDVEAVLAPGEMILVDGNRTLSAQGGAARVRYNKGLEGSSFKVLEGEVVVSDGASNTVITPSGELGHFSGIRLKFPEDKGVVVNDQLKVSFEWISAQNLGPYTVKVFSNERLVHSQAFQETQGTLKLPAVGSYSWTLHAPKAKGVSPTFAFTLYDRPLLEIESPVAGKIFTLTEKKQEQEIAFKWRQLLLEEPLMVIEKRADNAGEFQPFASERIQAQSENTIEKNIPAGFFRWRVELGKQVSNWNDFSVKAEEVPLPKVVVKEPVKPVAKPKPVKIASKPAPPPPLPTPTPPPPPPPENPPAPVAVEEPKKSGNGIEIPKIVSPDSGASFVTKDEQTNIDILARSVACDDYEVEVDTAKNFSNPFILKSENGKGRAPLKAGSYYIRARCWKDGDMGDWSLVRQFKIQKN